MSNLSGYIIRVGNGYVRWGVSPLGNLRAWSMMADPVDATVYSTSQEAMDARPETSDVRVGQVVLLRSCVH